jgi:hypothetical protein
MPQAVDVEWREARRRMHRIVKRELHLRKLRAPLGGLCNTDTAQDVLQDAINALGLTLGLRVVRCGHVELRPEKPEEVLPEVGDEPRVPVSDKRLWEAVVSEDMVDEELSRLRRWHTLLHGHQPDHLAQAAHKDQNASVVLPIGR